MKKLYAMIAVASLGMTAALSAQALEKLTSLTTASEAEDCKYFYNEANRLDSMAHNIYAENYRVAFSYAYDAQGRQTAEQGWQILSGQSTYSNVTRVLFEYYPGNEGKLWKRRNYNKFGSDFEMGAVMVYTYDAAHDNRLSKVSTYWDEGLSDLFMADTYVYNTQGQLIQITSEMASWFGSGMETLGAIKYEYDAEGRRVKELSFDAGANGGLTYTTTLEYVYDDEGRITEMLRYASNRDLPQAAYYYDYTDIPREDAVLPITLEEPQWLMDHTSYAIDNYEAYLMAQGSDKLSLYDTFYYHYTASSALPSLGIDAVKPSVIFSGRSLRLENASGLVEVYDLAGRRVLSARVEAGVEVSLDALTPATYIVRTPAGAQKVALR